MFDGLQIPPKVSPKSHYIKCIAEKKNHNIIKERKTKQMSNSKKKKSKKGSHKEMTQYLRVWTISKKKQTEQNTKYISYPILFSK